MEMFGYTARHVITMRTVTPLDDTDAIRQETVTDGWYIDLDTQLSCDPVNETTREGTTYRGVRFIVGSPSEARRGFLSGSRGRRALESRLQRRRTRSQNYQRSLSIPSCLKCQRIFAA
jgi:hypothetical protein